MSGVPVTTGQAPNKKFDLQDYSAPTCAQATSLSYCHRPKPQAVRLACETLESLPKFSFPTLKYKKVFVFLLLTS